VVFVTVFLVLIIQVMMLLLLSEPFHKRRIIAIPIELADRFRRASRRRHAFIPAASSTAPTPPTARALLFIILFDFPRLVEFSLIERGLVEEGLDFFIGAVGVRLRAMWCVQLRCGPWAAFTPPSASTPPPPATPFSTFFTSFLGCRSLDARSPVRPFSSLSTFGAFEWFGTFRPFESFRPFGTLGSFRSLGALTPLATSRALADFAVARPRFRFVPSRARPAHFAARTLRFKQHVEVVVIRMHFALGLFPRNGRRQGGAGEERFPWIERFRLLWLRRLARGFDGRRTRTFACDRGLVADRRRGRNFRFSLGFRFRRRFQAEARRELGPTTSGFGRLAGSRRSRLGRGGRRRARRRPGRRRWRCD
jgi:hypothetical protein